MKTLLKALALVAVALVLLVAGVFAWASWKSSSLLARTVETHAVEFPIPFPLDSAEIAELGLTPEAAAQLATERAIERGKHLVEARYVCVECHGADFGGGTMVDDPMMGRLLGPNITGGRGGRTAGYGPSDWDRIVRHGVRPDGTPAAMPSEDFRLMSDRELSDVVAYIRSRPAVDAEVPPVKLGPLGKLLIAQGALPLSADIIGEHQAEHALHPPADGVTVEFGRHVAGVCTGCHRPDLTGGPVPGGDPSWPPARNLTPHPDALGAWSYEDFVTAMKESRRPDGSPLREPMTIMAPYARNMTDVEMEALWLFVRSVAAVAPAGAG